MSVREDRMKQAIRRFFWIPTTAMLADCLTKQMISALIYDLLHFGYWQFDNKQQDPLCAMELCIAPDLDEADIVGIDKWPRSDELSDKRPIKRPEWESPSCASYVHISILHQ